MSKNSIWLVVAILCSFYFWTALSNGLPFDVSKGKNNFQNNDNISPEVQSAIPSYGYYNWLADSLLNGKLEMPMKPNPKLLELSNPYDVLANAGLNALDLSLYKGKYYMYFGIIPAITGFIPSRLLGFVPNQGMIAAIYATAALIFGCIILLDIQKHYNISKSVLLVGILVFGMGNYLPLLLRRPAVYEVAIAAGACFSTLGLLCLIRSITARNIIYLAAASLSIGLAVGSRPSYIITSGFLLCGLYSCWGKKHALTATVLPILIVGVMLASYNYARFESPLEFGVKYQLSSINLDPAGRNRIQNLTASAPSYLFTPPKLSPTFPFILPRATPIKTPKIFYGNDELIGLVFMVPIIILGALGAVSSKIRNTPYFAIPIGYGVAILTFMTFSFPAIHPRYQPDFAIPLILGLIGGWMIISMEKRGIKQLGFVAAGVTIIVGLLTSLTGAQNLLFKAHPELIKLADVLQFPNSSKTTSLLDATNLNGWNNLDGKNWYFRIYSPEEKEWNLSYEAIVQPVTEVNGACVDRIVTFKKGINWLVLRPVGKQHNTLGKITITSGAEAIHLAP